MQNIIAVVFDFDDTLAHDSTSSFLDSLGIDVSTFWNKRVDSLRASGWDPIPAYLYEMIQESKSRSASDRITKDRLAAWGKKIEFYPGVQAIFAQLEKQLESINPDAKIEFYLISSGIKEIIKHTKIVKHFSDFWACDFSYNAKGEIEFPRNIISFTDKTRYLFHISKGLIGPEFANKPFEVNRAIPREKLRIPFQQMIFVGDGYTDIPCFSLVKKEGGQAIAVYDPHNKEKWGRAWGFVENNRVSNLAPTDYRKTSSLHHSLVMAVTLVAQRMKLQAALY